MQYLKDYNNYISLKESFGDIGLEDQVNELFNFLKKKKKKVKKEGKWTISDDSLNSIQPEARDVDIKFPDAAFKKIQKQIDKKETPEKNLTFLKNLVNKAKSIDLKKQLIRLFLTSLAISLQTNEPMIPEELKLGKKLTPLTIELTDSPRKIGIDFDKVYNDTLEYIKYNLPSQKDKYKTYEDLITLKMHDESRGNWKVINAFGFLGLFQFGENELKGVGYGHVTKNKFKENPSIFPPKDQKIAYDRLLKLNKYFLRNYSKYIGQVIGGIYITEGGILGASSIGVGNIKTFLDSKGSIDKKDGMGVSVSYLLNRFKNFNVSNIKAMTYKEWQDYKNGRK